MAKNRFSAVTRALNDSGGACLHIRLTQANIEAVNQFVQTAKLDSGLMIAHEQKDATHVHLFIVMDTDNIPMINDFWFQRKGVQYACLFDAMAHCRDNVEETLAFEAVQEVLNQCPV